MTDVPERVPGLRVEPVTPAEHALLGRLWQLYQHDLSASRGTLPDPSGRYPHARLPRYLGADPDRSAYLVQAGAGTPTAPAGFACVRGLAGGPAAPVVMGEFFVVRAVRRQGVGRAVARAVLQRHPGPWEIPFQEANAGAARFWRALATEVAGTGWAQELRPVPGRAGEHDTWLTLHVGAHR